MEQLLSIVGKGDNIAIAGMIPIVIFFTGLALREALRHDRLIREGRQDEIIDRMHE